jgi:hypothetical protein
MALSYRMARDLQRDLSSTCPDGVEIVTRWPDEWPYFSEPAQIEHAQIHRNAVLAHLQAMRLLDRAA